MKVEDTLLKENQIPEYVESQTIECLGDEIGMSPLYQLRTYKASGLAQAQAQATWDAREPEIAQARQRGIKEVVEWFEKNAYGCPEVDYKKWQAQLKEWLLLPHNKSLKPK